MTTVKRSTTRLVEELRNDLGDTWAWPNARDSYVFLVSEVGELGDAILRWKSKQYARANPRTATIDDVAEEMADVVIMLATLALAYDIDLDAAFQAKMDHLRGRHLSDSQASRRTTMAVPT